MNLVNSLSLRPMNSTEWFASWFDSPYYHLLYRKRNKEEARFFINNLLQEIRLPPNSNVLDLACGKGRHSKTLCESGLNVLGVDLSEMSIKAAKEFESENLKFKVHDMRLPVLDQKFDAIFNLFTSFGYFPKDEDNLHVLNNIHGMLRFNGYFVFDYLNSSSVIKGLVKKEEKQINDIQFCIEREFDGAFLKKSIEIDDHGKVFHFEENVRAYTYGNLQTLLEAANFKIIKSFGNFELMPYDENESDRAIFICKRNSEV